jgi:hypothetical protein
VDKLNELSDAAIVALLGERTRQERLNQNMTQAELAERSGINRIVLTRLEGGRGCTLGSFIRILRSLGKLDHLDVFLPEPGISPIQLAKLGGRAQLEAAGKRGRPRKGE